MKFVLFSRVLSVSAGRRDLDFEERDNLISEGQHKNQEYDHKNKYGSIVHSEPSLTRDIHEERGIWMPLRTCLQYVFIYIAISVIAYSYVFERWSIIDSVYFAVATFTTVGYSDQEPSSEGGQVFTIFFAMCKLMTFKP